MAGLLAHGGSITWASSLRKGLVGARGSNEQQWARRPANHTMPFPIDKLTVPTIRNTSKLTVPTIRNTSSAGGSGAKAPLPHRGKSSGEAARRLGAESHV